MAISFSPAQLEHFRREAKKLSRELSVKHSEALDRIAAKYGFTNWSLLTKHSNTASMPVAEPLSASRGLRYYLHGDVVEGEPGKCYCASCDVFGDLNHFQQTSGHEAGEDGERFLSSLARWDKLTPAEKGNRYRPVNAQNVLQQSAEAAREVAEAVCLVREASRSPFHLWLERRLERNDAVGDLARDVLRDKDFPMGAATRREMEDYLSRYGDHVMRAMREAWREYRLRPR
ncbi:hypothetical protein JFK97_14055 [Chromobacterium phragmitis]|uniref:YozE family protein n=1 Tax=Chromobacterium amazonense TaxID=1382803 RepID=UPI0021B77647|nr:YozE family protein [Chromobacterium amazonense]MBM2885517.1 hypothetical protein [Chromobacterium amazonense]MDE1716486.1 YozE family protein [Chromobacterium amazonense]